MCAHSLLFFDASAETETKHAAPAGDRRAFAGSVIVGRLRPEILRHILVPSRIHGRSIPELSMAFRGDVSFGFAGLLSIAALSGTAGRARGISGASSASWNAVVLARAKNPGRSGRSDRHHKTAD